MFTPHFLSPPPSLAPRSQVSFPAGVGPSRTYYLRMDSPHPLTKSGIHAARRSSLADLERLGGSMHVGRRLAPRGGPGGRSGPAPVGGGGAEEDPLGGADG